MVVLAVIETQEILSENRNNDSTTCRDFHLAKSSFINNDKLSILISSVKKTKIRG